MRHLVFIINTDLGTNHAQIESKCQFHQWFYWLSISFSDQWLHSHLPIKLYSGDSFSRKPCQLIFLWILTNHILAVFTMACGAGSLDMIQQFLHFIGRNISAAMWGFPVGVCARARVCARSRSRVEQEAGCANGKDAPLVYWTRRVLGPSKTRPPKLKASFFPEQETWGSKTPVRRTIHPNAICEATGGCVFGHGRAGIVIIASRWPRSVKLFCYVLVLIVFHLLLFFFKPHEFTAVFRSAGRGSVRNNAPYNGERHDLHQDFCRRVALSHQRRFT